MFVFYSLSASTMKPVRHRCCVWRTVDTVDTTQYFLLYLVSGLSDLSDLSDLSNTEICMKHAKDESSPVSSCINHRRYCCFFFPGVMF